MADSSRENDPVLDALDASTRYEIEQVQHALDRLEGRASVRWGGGLGRRQQARGKIAAPPGLDRGVPGAGRLRDELAVDLTETCTGQRVELGSTPPCGRGEVTGLCVHGNTR